MKTALKVLTALALPVAFASAQQQVATLASSGGCCQTDTVAKDSTPAVVSVFSTLKPIVIQHIRPNDLRGLNVFESPKTDPVAYTGFKLDWGAAFTQQFQALQHENTATPVMSGTTNTNQLLAIGHGFNNAVANLYLNAQVAPGIRVAMQSYLSARHHQESWVKDGYALIDASPIDNPILNNIMKYTTLKIGHFEINYGDEHFRRSDNGQAAFNPFVGNLMTDAFTTEIGGELYVRASGFLGMASITGGEVKGDITNEYKRAPSYIGKLGYDKQLNEDLRVRLTGSMYKTDRSASNTLYSGDRAGSRYYSIMENTASSTTSNAWSGELRPGFGSRVTAFVVNPFVKYQGLEVFGNIETAKGQSWADSYFRNWRQLAGGAAYRFWDEKLYGAYRYNRVGGQFNTTIKPDVFANRWQVAGGWYVNPMMLLKVEYMNQKYYGFPANNILNGGFVKGLSIESTLAF